MTLRELLHKVKSQITDTAEVVRSLLQKAEVAGEYTVYPIKGATKSKWHAILSELGIGDIPTAVGVTGYCTGEEFIGEVASALKKKYSEVHGIQVDRWRTILFCGKSQNDPQPLVVCTNWYETSREETKAQHDDASDDSSTEEIFA
jgi:hypothetical protein